MLGGVEVGGSAARELGRGQVDGVDANAQQPSTEQRISYQASLPIRCVVWLSLWLTAASPGCGA